MKITSKDVFYFIIEAISPFKRTVVIMLAVMLVWSFDLSFRPYILKTIIDRVSLNTNEDIATSIFFPALLYFLMCLLISTMFRFYDYYITIKMIPNLRKNIANYSFESLLKQSFYFYQNNFAGSLTNQINNLISDIPEILQIFIDRLLSVIIAVSIAVFALWKVNYVFGICMLVWVILFFLISYIASKKLVYLADNWAEAGSLVTGKLVDSLSNILAINLFAQKRNEAKIMEKAFIQATIAEQKFHWLYFWIWIFYGYSFAIMQGINLYFLIIKKQAGLISTGDFIVVLTINSALVDYLWKMAQDLSHFSKLWGEIIQALRTIKHIPEYKDKSDAKDLKVIKGEIKLDNITFHYKNSTALFENKTVLIKAGEKVGLVGYSGSGKSSFVNLILRLYEANSGDITIDNQSIYDITSDSLRKNIAMIPQDPTLFNRSLMENIRYGKISALDEEVILAAKHAHAHDFIMNMPEQYNSIVGERGIKISGGQRQRIAIARAFLKNSPILILDEATSQLDSITEGDIQDSLWKLMNNRTTIIIAHRLSTLLHMDRILVFEQGKIVGDGSHKALLKECSLYKILWNAQVAGFLPEKK